MSQFYAEWAHEQQMKWFALRVAPNRDFAARIAIERRGIETFLPIERIQRWKRKGRQRQMTEVERAILRGYLFVRLDNGTALADLVHAMTRNRVIGARLILGPVEVQGRPGTVSASDIEALRRYDGRLLTPDAPRIFLQGEKIVICDGPMTGTAGKVLKSRKGKLHVDTARGIMVVNAEAVT
jgi:transcription antitermination factor NusG